MTKEEINLIKKTQSGCEESFNELLEKNKRLIFSISIKHKRLSLINRMTQDEYWTLCVYCFYKCIKINNLKDFWGSLFSHTLRYMILDYKRDSRIIKIPRSSEKENFTRCVNSEEFSLNNKESRHSGKLEILSELTELERTVLIYRDVENFSLMKTAKTLGMRTEYEVVKIRNKALEKLRLDYA